MILDNEIKLISSSKIMAKLKEIGIIVNYGDEYILPIEKLWLNSNYKINVKCDVCGNEKLLCYSLYNKNIKNHNIYCCCNKCAWIKNKKTNLERYGLEYYDNMEKKKQTCMERYGVEFVLQNNEIREKSKQTSLERYGDENYNNREQCKETCLEKYGVENVLLNEDIMRKSRITCLEKYGVEDPRTAIVIKEKRKDTMIERYGEEYYNNREKYKNTCLEKYGLDSSNKVEEIKKKKVDNMLKKYGFISNSITEESKRKLRETNIKRYGVEYPMQVLEFFEKQQKNSKKINYYNDKLYYQSSYEKHFLDYMNNINMLDYVERGFCVDFIFENKTRKHFPDFYISKYNLIVEIKSDYYYNKYLDKNISKMNACIEIGYNYLYIVNKNYSVLNKILDI